MNRPPADLVTLPAYRSLASRFAAAGLGGAAGTRDDAAAIGAMAFGTWALEHARRAHEEALHLDRIATRWSAEALDPLDLDRVARWQDVVRDHARRLRRAAEALRAQLATLAPAPGEERDHDASGGPLAVRGVQDVRPAVARLVALAAAQHDAVRQMFDPELEAPRVPVDIGALTAVLRRAEAQAAWFDEPWTMGERTAFEIAGSARHMFEKAP